jgi:large subunit ribosomal protein L4
MEINILNIQGADTGKKVALPEAIFGIEPNDHAVYLDVKQYLANQRQGTHKSKEKWEIKASTKKLKKQKGTGGARAGSKKSPLFVGGARVFGPRPRDYGFKLNRKLKQLARKSALTYKAKDKMITVVEGFNIETPKTKTFLDILNNLNLSGKKTLLVLPELNMNIVMSGRNIPRTRIMTAGELNTYEIMKASNIILLEESVKVIENTLSTEK